MNNDDVRSSKTYTAIGEVVLKLLDAQNKFSQQELAERLDARAKEEIDPFQSETYSTAAEIIRAGKLP